MNYLGLGVVGRAGARFVSSCKDFYYDLNGANLTGAVDVIAIRQIDGSLKATPFHVRFGKWGVLRTGDLQKEIEIEVNGQSVDNRMMLTESGSAYFVKPKLSSFDNGAETNTDSETPVASSTPTSSHNPATTPIPDPLGSEPQEDLEQLLNDPLSSVEHIHVEENEHNNNEQDTEIKDNKTIQGGIKEETESCDETDKEIQDDLFLPQATPTLSLSSLPVNIENSNSAAFYTPTDDFEQFRWPLGKDSPHSLPSDIDSGVLSDSAVGTRKYSEGGMALSDSEIETLRDNTKSLKTQGAITHALSTAEEGRLPQKQAVRRGIWGTLSRIWRNKKRRRYSSIEDGVYLDDLDLGIEDKADYFPVFHDPSSFPTSQTQSPQSDVTTTSGISSLSSFSPTDQSTDDIDKVVSVLSNVSISLCGGLVQGRISEEAFTSSQISFEDFYSNTEMLNHPDLVVKIDNKYYKWQVAAPMIMSGLIYLQTLPAAAHNNLMKKYMPNKSRPSFWNFWGRDNSESELDSNKFKSEETPSSVLPLNNETTPSLSSSLPDSWPHVENLSSDEGLTDEESGSHPTNTSRNRQRSMRRKKFVFTSELTSEELLKWPLKMGKNELVFSITTKIQGTTKAFCTLYLWDYTDKLVISDFDGTITRSDVAGHVLPLIGKDWTHNGVIELFSAINRNGYRFVYLSARAIGQSWYTKNYLRSTRRGERFLPDGPLLVTPFSLYTAFKKEVIERKPEEFKILCLEQIRSFFPNDYNPFHSGFGNKHSDAKSYLKVDIPMSRIFTVNHKGEIRNELSWTFQSSYNALMELVDAQFPPLAQTSPSSKIVKTETDETDHPQGLNLHHFEQQINYTPPCEEFSSFMFWHQPFNSFDQIVLPDL